jgi:small subunit ribosomal protein S16
MVKIRLQRIGRRNQPYYRLVVTDSKFGPKSGRFIEIVGSYDPKAGKVEIDADRATHWVGKGASVSDTVHNFFIDKGIVKGKKVNALPKKTPIKKEAEETPEETTSKVEASVEEGKKEESVSEVETPVADPKKEEVEEKNIEENEESKENTEKEEETLVEETLKESPSETASDVEESPEKKSE